MLTDASPQRRFVERLPLLANVLYDSDEAIVGLDGGWFVTAWNLGAERMYGWSADEVVGRHVTEFAHLGLAADERAALRRTIAEHGRWRGEVVAHRKDGGALWVDVSTVAIAAGFVGIHRDVTARKLADEAAGESHRRMTEILERMSDAFVAVDGEWRVTYVNERALQRLRSRTGPPMSREEAIGEDFWSCVPDAWEIAAYEHLQRAMSTREHVRFEAPLRPRQERVETVAYPSETGLTIYWRSIDTRKQAAARQAAAADLGLRALAGDDVQKLLDDAAAVTAQALDVELVGVVEILPDGEELLLRAGVGWPDDTVGRRRAPAGANTLAGCTVDGGEPVVSPDLGSDARFALSPLLAEQRPVSGATVVIAGRDRPFGSLGAFSRSPRLFDADDVSFLQTVANTISAAVERAAAQTRLIGVKEAERRRIARDLHDEALQTLAFAQVQAALPDLDPLARLTAVRPALERVAGQLRSAIYDLRLGGHANVPFPSLIAELVELHRAVAVDCEIELAVGAAVPAEPLGPLGTEVLRILGEALNNARRHAHARVIHVRVDCAGGRMLAEVADDGCGFDATVIRAAGHGAGIDGMHERCELLHGRLEIRAVAGHGTRVLLDVPMPSCADAGSPPPLRVLLVEDETSVRDSIAWILDREPDVEVVAATGSIGEARELLHDVDVVVIDLALPDGFGADLAVDLHRIHPRAHALVLTASVDDSEIARAYECGASVVLNKIAQLGQLVDAVRRLGAQAATR